MKRVMIFVDGSNFYHALKAKTGSAQLDFGHLIAELVGPNRELARVYYYNAPVNAQEVPAQHRRQQAFFGALKRIPYFEVKLGRLVRRSHGMVEKGVDVRLATDMVAAGLLNRYDVAILVSGDGDFTDAVQVVKDAGKHVELAYPRVDSLSRALCDVCDVFVELVEGSHLKRP